MERTPLRKFFERALNDAKIRLSEAEHEMGNLSAAYDKVQDREMTTHSKREDEIENLEKEIENLKGELEHKKAYHDLMDVYAHDNIDRSYQAYDEAICKKRELEAIARAAFEAYLEFDKRENLGLKPLGE